MNWYMVKLVFSVVSGSGLHTPQFDEQLRLISSHNPEEAYHKARILGLRNQDSFVNDKGGMVRWHFVAVADLLPIEEFKDGMELYTSTHETDDSSTYIRQVEQKGNYIHSKSMLQTLQLF